MKKSNDQLQMHYQLSNKELQTQYGISIEECGLTAVEWHQRYGDLSAKDAINTFAKKYDLQRLNLQFW
ncbi:MAG: hypothetical protein WEB02_01465 [Methylophaga sp.]